MVVAFLHAFIDSPYRTITIPIFDPVEEVGGLLIAFVPFTTRFLCPMRRGKFLSQAYKIYD
jgi:hypothetical protein